MFTVEFEKDAAVITVLSEDDSQEDVEVIVGDDSNVWIRQYQEYKNEFDVICLTWQQLKDICVALDSPEGMFQVVRRTNENQ